MKALLDGDAGGSGRGSRSRFFPLRGTRTFRRRPGRDGRSVHLTARHGEVCFVGMDRRKAEATGNDDGGGGRVESMEWSRWVGEAAEGSVASRQNNDTY